MQLDMKMKRKYICEAVQRYKPRVSTTFSGTEAVHLRYRSGTNHRLIVLSDFFGRYSVSFFWNLK